METTSAFAALLGETLVNRSGDVNTAEALAGKEAVALYFSAHWCPPCRGFTPKLAESYQANLQAKGLEVVFVSSDKDEAQFKEYFEQMPWLALPYGARDLKAKLSEQYGVQGIPTLVILDASGKTINKDGRSAVMEDPTGESFPWKKAEEVQPAQPNEMPRATTKQLMKQQSQSGPFTVVCMPLCCFWVPMLFFMGAANTLSTCESDHFVVWMKVYGLAPLACAMLVQIIASFWACRGSGEHFKNALRLQGLTSLITVALFIWGWVEYMKTSEEKCVGDGDINPRALALAWLIMGSFGVPLSFCAALKQIRNPTANPAAGAAPAAQDKPEGTEEVTV